MRCLVAGMSVDATAGRLYLSRNTVRTHIQNVLGKLNVHSAVAAVAVARRACPAPMHRNPNPTGTGLRPDLGY
jgi:DNA-binding CsgD family transcriptional regulator